jgi:glucokinase
MLLAGDIGGTKTDLEIFSIEAGPHSPLAETKVHSADYAGHREGVPGEGEEANRSSVLCGRRSGDWRPGENY